MPPLHFKTTAIVRKRKFTDTLPVIQSDYSSYSSEEESFEQEEYYDSLDDDHNMSGEDITQGRKQDRMLMREWLIDQVNRNEDTCEIPGLEWMNQERTLIKIPWTHASRHGWEAGKDSSLFKSWAIHTGKYKEGDKDPDGGPKKWKANFRCAMNSLPDIVADSVASRKKGHDAFRVYRLLPEKKRSPQSKKARTNSDSQGSDQHYKKYTTKADRLENLRHAKETLKRKLSDKQQQNVDQPSTTSTGSSPTATNQSFKQENYNNNCINPLQIYHFNNGTDIRGITSTSNSPTDQFYSGDYSDKTHLYEKKPALNLQFPKFVESNLWNTSGESVEREEEVMTSQSYYPPTGMNNVQNSTFDFEGVNTVDEHSYARNVMKNIPSFVENDEDSTSDYNSSSPHSSECADENILAECVKEIEHDNMFSAPSTPVSPNMSSLSSGLGPTFSRTDSFELGGSYSYPFIPQSYSAAVGQSVTSPYTNTCTTSMNQIPSYMNELKFGEI